MDNDKTHVVGFIHVESQCQVSRNVRSDGSDWLRRMAVLSIQWIRRPRERDVTRPLINDSQRQAYDLEICSRFTIAVLKDVGRVSIEASEYTVMEV